MKYIKTHFNQFFRRHTFGTKYFLSTFRNPASIGMDAISPFADMIIYACFGQRKMRRFGMMKRLS